MDDRVRITIEVDAADHAVLSSLANDRALSVPQLAAEVLHSRAALERDWEQAVREGLEDIEAGRTISNEESLQNAAERRRRWFAARQPG